MDKEKTPEELRKEKEQLKVQDQKTENILKIKTGYQMSKTLGEKRNIKEANDIKTLYTNFV